MRKVVGLVVGFVVSVYGFHIACAQIFQTKGAYGASPSKIDFYGFFKIDAVWQDSKAIGDVYVLWVLPKDDQNSDNQFTINFRHSRFGFNLYKSYKNFRIFGKMEMDFYTECHEEGLLPWNPNHAPLRARRVFAGVEWGTWQLLAGLDWLTISQLYPHTSNFPTGTFMGNPAYRMPQIRLSKLFDVGGSRIKAQIAAEKPYAFSTGIYPFDVEPANDAGFPGIEIRLAYETKLFGRPTLAAIWGHYSQEEYDTARGEEDADSCSIGLELKIPLPISRKAFILGELWYGSNFDGYYSCGINQGTEFRLTDGTTTTDLGNHQTSDIVWVEEIEAVGGYVEFELFWTPKLVTHLGWGIDNPQNDDLSGVSNARLQQQMAYTNFLYRITKEFGLGMEYMYVKTDYPDNNDASLNRVMGSLYYFF